MRCEEARAILIPADEPRIAEADVLRALEHAEACPGCRIWIEEDRDIARLIRRALPRPQAPREVRERIYQALARERAPAAAPAARRSARLRRAPWALLPAAAGAALALWLLAPDPDPRGPGTIFVQDYLRKAVEREAIRSSSHEAVAAFLMRELGAAVQPPQVPGADLLGAEICLLEGERGARLTYIMGGREVSYYVVPGRGKLDGLASPKPATHLVSEGPLKVVLWSDERFAHAVVGEHSMDYLLTFAHAAGGY